MSSSKHPASVGAYSIIRELGRGGMGVVYLARDTRLERQVAIKALPAHLSADPDRLARFEREARILASLNHPNIAAIHGLEESAGHRYLILEHVEGLTLAQRLERGPMALEDALDAARQIALALEAAHEKGVIHRDLKPGNVMLRADGAVKVLDFGLARTAEGAPSSTGVSPDSPTISSPAAPVHSPTIPGAIMGTAGYMSPEQARGKPVDKRTDIFSFGCVLYEMLTGAGPFPGETVTDSIGALLHREPEWSLLPRDTPPAISLLLLRCLAKDRSKRLHDIADARIELEQPHGAAVSIEGPGARRVSAPAVAGLIAALGLAGAGGGVLGARLLRPAPTAHVQLEMAAPPGVLLNSAGDVAGPATISPDGASIAFVAHEKDATPRIWVRRLDSAESQPLAGTELATFPFWSPDSRSLAFFVDGKLRRVDLDTRTVSTICEARAGRGGAWMSNGVIVFTPDFQAPLSRVDAGGGTPVAITQLDTARHTSHRWPCALPDGRRFLFSAIHHEPGHDEDAGIYLGSLDGAAPKRVMQNSGSVGYANGRMLFVTEGTLSAVRLDLRTGRLTEAPREALRGVATDLSVWRASFSVSASGVLAYHRAAPATGSTKQAPNASGGSATPQEASATRLIRYRRDGRPANIALDDTPQISLGVSPDEKRAVTALFGGGADGWDLWGFSLVNRLHDPDEEKPAPERLTFLRGLETSPVWSPDATEIAFCVAFGSAEQPKGVYRKRIGGGEQRLILDAPSEQLSAFPSDWSSDGRHLIYSRGSWVNTGDSDILALPLEGGEPIPLVATPANEFAGRLSPDGKWLAYASAESANKSEVYVIPFAPARAGAAADPGAPARSAVNERWRVSIAGGDSPAWRKDGKELFFMNNSGVLMAVGVRSEGDSIAFDTGKPLFQTGWTSGKEYAVLEGGEQFLVQEDVVTDASAPISVVLQWPALLKP